MLTKYILVRHGKIIGSYDKFIEAFKDLLELGEGEIYRGELILRLSVDEVLELKNIIVGSPVEPVEAPVVRKTKKIIVLDQMFKGFYSEVLSKKLKNIIVYEIVGRGIDKPVRVDNIVKYPAETDYDVAKLIEELVSKGYKVYFFTGDKKLYSHVAMIQGVKAYYMPPSEYPSKEVLVDKMLKIVMEV